MCEWCRSWVAHGRQPPVRWACRFRTHPRNLPRERIRWRRARSAIIRSRRAVSVGLHVKSGSLDSVIQRVFGIAARAMDFSSESGVGRKFALWDSEETGLSCSPKWVPDAKPCGCHPHRRFFDIHPGTRKDSPPEWFTLGGKPSKSLRPPGFPKGFAQTGAVPSPGVKSTAPVDWRVWGL
jgi:hypothetical protein